MAIFDIYKSVINTGNFVVEDMEERIETMYAQGKITSDERVELLNLASDNADESKQIDIVAKLAELEARIAVIESAGVVTWTYGMSVAKGRTVLYDILKEGIMRYCRYDGGRSATSLAPGKLNGWVILDSAGGSVTHTVEKDEDGNIILVEVTESTESTAE